MCMKGDKELTSLTFFPDEINRDLYGHPHYCFRNSVYHNRLRPTKGIQFSALRPQTSPFSPVKVSPREPAPTGE
jgi:hypothetical protein